MSGRAGLNKCFEFPNRIYCETKTFDGMSGLKGGKVRYFQDRCTNAYRMLRTGRFSLMWKSVWVEVDKRVTNIRAKMFSIIGGDSFFVQLDKRKVFPVSYRPTTPATASSVKLQVDVIVLASELKSIRSTFVFPEQKDLK